MRIKSAKEEETTDFFFYGTLLVPAILERVLHRSVENLSFYTAVLPGFTRHCVKGEDYPAIVNESQLKQLSPDSSFSPEERSTRGTLVKGLNNRDSNLLDIFEGSQYARIRTKVQVIGSSSASNLQNIHLPKLRDSRLPEAEAWVYVWSDPVSDLEPHIWSFEAFMMDKVKQWTGLKTKEYDEVDKHHAQTNGGPTDGDEALVIGKQVEGSPDFGHNMLQYWRFKPGFAHFNIGSYGAPPRAVVQYMRDLSDRIESMPDIYIRKDWLPMLNEVRSGVAKLINADFEEVVMVPNTTVGINTVVRNIDWKEGDVILMYSTTYGAVGQTMKYICDTHPGVTIEVVDLNLPCPHAKIVQDTEAALTKYNVPSDAQNPQDKTKGKRIRLAVIDTITSNPGIVLPWHALVATCRKYGVLSLVDGAHSIGQQKLDVKAGDPDFLLTNCHKWLYSHRGGAVFYVPLRNQHIIRTSLPTSSGYESRLYPTLGPDGKPAREWTYAHQWEWNGTLDWTPIMGITAAIDFRKSIGGEDRIINYCHSLAVQGGILLAKKWGTQVMENPDLKDGELTAAKVNVALPEMPPPESLDEQMMMIKFISENLYAQNFAMPQFRHNGKWWCRLSTQVWLELSDFTRLGDAVNGIVERVRRGEHKQTKVPETDLMHDPADLTVEQVIE